MIISVKKNYDIMTGEFSCYEIVKNGKTSHVPLDEANTDYQEIQNG